MSFLHIELLTHYSSCLMNSFCFYVMKLKACLSETLCQAPLCREPRSPIQRFAAFTHTAIAVETNRYVLSQQDVISICHSVHAEGQCLCLTSAAVLHPNAAGAVI